MPLTVTGPSRFPPRGPRSVCNVYGWLLVADDSLLEMTIRNVSPDGCMGECLHTPPVGERVGVAVANAAVFPGEVRWTSQGQFGIRFHRPLPQYLLDTLALV